VTVHVYPSNDLIEHEREGTECICGPDVEYADPDTGETYEKGPLVIHHALDGREQWEMRP
jgi:hypothetical protein